MHLQLLLDYNVQEMSLDEKIRVIRDMEAQITTLIKSNKLYEEKWRQFFTLFTFYKQFYLENKNP
jgi:hypothetical protein